jgi:hypothetical protein
VSEALKLFEGRHAYALLPLREPREAVDEIVGIDARPLARPRKKLRPNLSTHGHGTILAVLADGPPLGSGWGRSRTDAAETFAERSDESDRNEREVCAMARGASPRVLCVG